MKGALRAFLILCYAAALVSAAIGVRLFIVSRTGAVFLCVAGIIPLLALTVHYVFLGFWNPLKLFKKELVVVASTEVTRAPWST